MIIQYIVNGVVYEREATQEEIEDAERPHEYEPTAEEILSILMGGDAE